MQCSKDLFDHLVGAREQEWRHCEPNCPRGLEIDDQFELRRPLHRQICRLFSLEDFVDINRGPPHHRTKVGVIRDQSTGADNFAVSVNRRQATLTA